MSSPPRERGRQPERARCAILAVALLKVVRCLTVPSAIELLTLCLCTSRCDHSLHCGRCFVVLSRRAVFAPGGRYSRMLIVRSRSAGSVWERPSTPVATAVTTSHRQVRHAH